jgi:hypothetical protein
MAKSHVASALVNKRAEIAGMITRTEQHLGQFRADVLRHAFFSYGGLICQRRARRNKRTAQSVNL